MRMCLEPPWEGDWNSVGSIGFIILKSSPGSLPNIPVAFLVQWAACQSHYQTFQSNYLPLSQYIELLGSFILKRKGSIK